MKPKNADVTEVVNVPLIWIEPSELNPRKEFAEKELKELAASIAAHGVQQPIVVRSLAKDRYTIVMGERRYRASKIAGLETIPAIVRDSITEAVHVELALIENLHRSDLNPIEEAAGYATLRDVCGYKLKDIAQKVNRDASLVGQRLRLLELPNDVQKMLAQGKLTPAHGAALVRFVSAPGVVSRLASLALKHGWTARNLSTEIMPFSYELEKAGLIASFENHGSSKVLFDSKENCKSCPFNAYVTGRYSLGYCLRPEHYAELNEEAARKLHEQASAEKKGNQPMNVSNMSRDMYVDLRYNKVEGCTAKCVCRARAVDWFTDKPFQICTDPKAHRKLKMAAARAKKLAVKEKMADVAAMTEFLVSGVEDVDGPELLMLVVDKMSHSKPKYLREAARTLGVALPEDDDFWKGIQFAHYSDERRDALKILAGIPSIDLIRVVTLATCREEINAKIQNGWDGFWLDWYVNSGEAAAPSKTPLEEMIEGETVDDTTGGSNAV